MATAPGPFHSRPHTADVAALAAATDAAGNVRHSATRCRSARSLMAGVILPVLMAGCAHGASAQAEQVLAGETPDDLILSEPQPPYETHYSFDFKCRRQGIRRSELRLSEVRMTGVTGDTEHGGSVSSITSIMIDGVTLDKEAIKQINAHFPDYAIQERPWLKCHYESIEIGIPYRGGKEDGLVLFSVKIEDHSIEFYMVKP